MSVQPGVAEAKSCWIEGPAPVRAMEFNAFRYSGRGVGQVGLPLAPGGVERDENEKPAILHVGPGRYFVPEPTVAMLLKFDELAASGIGARFDVDGKWQWLTLIGEGSTPLLSSGIDIRRILSGRECASSKVFDCPVIVASRPDAFDLWVHSSYAENLRESIERVSCRLEIVLEPRANRHISPIPSHRSLGQ
jgi:hypothetical protein